MEALKGNEVSYTWFASHLIPCALSSILRLQFHSFSFEFDSRHFDFVSSSVSSSTIGASSFKWARLIALRVQVFVLCV